MRYPDFLKDNGRIGFIAPSFGCASEPYYTLFNGALRRFGNKGYETVLGPNCFLEEGIGKSNSGIKCAEEINDFFVNDRCDVIISCGGGETMCEDLPYVDFAGIQSAKPKWYMGYSDNTNLTFILNTICDTASIYGPNAASFGMDSMYYEKSMKYAKEAFEIISGRRLKVNNYDEWMLEPNACGINVIEGARELIIQEDNEYGLGYDAGEVFPVEWVNDKPYVVMPYSQKLYRGAEPAASGDEISFCGRLIGGCLDCLVTLAGTEYDKVSEYIERYKEDGFIWFIEACDLSTMGIRRALWQLKNAGWFKYLKGFIVGRPLRYNDDFAGSRPVDSFLSQLGDLNVPIIMDADLGHLSPSMPIISGAMARVEAVDNKLRIEYELR